MAYVIEQVDKGYIGKSWELKDARIYNRIGDAKNSIIAMERRRRGLFPISDYKIHEVKVVITLV